MLSLCPACARYLFLLDCKYLSKLFLWCLVCDATIVCEETYVFDSHCWNNMELNLFAVQYGTEAHQSRRNSSSRGQVKR